MRLVYLCMCPSNTQESSNRNICPNLSSLFDPWDLLGLWDANGIRRNGLRKTAMRKLESPRHSFNPFHCQMEWNGLESCSKKTDWHSRHHHWTPWGNSNDKFGRTTSEKKAANLVAVLFSDIQRNRHTASVFFWTLKRITDQNTLIFPSWIERSKNVIKAAPHWKKLNYIPIQT